MTREEFLSILEKRLKALPKEEIENAIAYYTEYLSEAGKENEQEALSKLAPPKQIASKLIAEFAISDKPHSKPVSLSTIIWAVLAAPIAIPIAVTVLVLLLSIVLLLFTFSLVGVVFAFCGFLLTLTSIPVFITSFSTGLFVLGSSLIYISLGSLLAWSLHKLTKLTVAWIIQIISKLILRRSAK